MKSALVPHRLSNLLNLRHIVPIALGVCSLTLIQPVMAQEQMTRTLTVTGQGEEAIATTITRVQLGVEAQGDTAAEVQREAARRSAAVVELLRSRNVSRLQTTGINLNPVYNYTNNEQKLVGYSATNIVSFEIETERAGTLLDEAVKAGASRIDGVSFRASDEAIARGQQEALREATQDAQDQADVVLRALGLTRREIVGIQLNGAPPIVRPPMPEAFAARAADASTPVVGGEQQVQASVTLQISY